MKRFLSQVLRRLVSVSKDQPWFHHQKPHRSCPWTRSRAKEQPQGQEGKQAPVPAPCGVDKTILTVFLNDTQQMLTEVPITPETTCRDVVDFCKEAGESGCHLAEVWQGNERGIPFEHLMYEHLQRWGPRRIAVKFYLRHEECPSHSSLHESPEQSSTGRGGNTDLLTDNQAGVPRVELTLSELQEMATRQQQQIEAQQQMLVAKEQRLRYLQHQGGRQGQGPGGQTQSEAEKLQRLKERVESQEAKLKKIRAMRGQVDYSKLINGNLSAEIEHVSGLFQEKQAELQSAVLRVDQLTQQLDDLRRGRLNGLQPLGAPLSGSAALELRKLYQELQVRNKLNREQSGKLQQNKELLNKKNSEVTMMDKRIGDLRERLQKKRAEARHTDHTRSLTRVNGGPPSPQPAPCSSGRVAAVCPYIQVPVPGRQEGGYSLPPDPLKPPHGFNHARSHSEEEGCGVRKPPSQWKVSDLDVLLAPAEQGEGPRSPSGAENVNSTDAAWPGLSKSVSSFQPSDWRNTSPDQMDSSRLSMSRPPPSYGTYPSTGHPSMGSSTSSLPRSAPATLAWQRPGTSSTSQQIQQRISIPPSPTPSSQPQGERPDPPLAVAVRPYVPDKASRPQSPRKGPATMNSSSIYHMYLQQPATKNYGSLSNRSTVKAVYGKPVLPCSSTSPSPVPFQQGALSPGRGMGGEDVVDREGGDSSHPPPSVHHIPRPLSPTKLTPVAHSPLRYQSDADLEVLRRRLANAPRPLKKRSSITEPEGPAGPNIQKLLYQRFNTLAGGMEAGSATPFYQPAFLGTGLAGGLVEMENNNTANVCPLESASLVVSSAEGPNSDTRLSPPTPADKQRTSPIPSPSPSPPGQSVPCTATPQHSPPASDRLEDQNNNTQAGSKSPGSSPSPETTQPQQRNPSPRAMTPTTPSKVKRTNLKKPESERTGHGLRVKFNPLALLLDASLEGEFDLVQRIIYEVVNPSTANDEGITPLHNAVCAGHHHIVKFLLDFGVNVNAADSDGWTPLHCAASCNSVHLCKLLVESGAAIFATTISDVETAADKCEEMEDGYAQCSQFLYGVQEKLGVMNKGSVYALWNYEAQSPDELSFHEGDAITILRRRDDTETEWWWARLHEHEGYVPRNLLGLYPRIKPRQRSLA
ncbi:protein phosphatase 1, regulatory subunit 13Ba isoform X2 [Hypomesus transpacificus]|uniref:protein phosphatase 1, regulatory subunit 13Ba isoform X2 n=1 Tax=Hypomesus transpacificus TaxID=137520 RepID=UPI001F078BEE|nr:protein phosphatase 1, regulatory subunit 13Ba isoform X2 [Hypomesus transpacificus]